MRLFLHTLRFRPDDPVPAPSPGATGGAAVEEVKELIPQLTEAIQSLADRDTDAQTDERIEGIKQDLETRLQAMTEEINRSRRSFDVDDEEAPSLPELRRHGKVLSLQERLNHIHSMSPGKAARWAKRPEADVEAFQQAADAVVFMQAILGKQAADSGQRFDVRETDYWQDTYLPALHAMDSATAAEGQEFVPKLLSGNLIERVNLALRVAALFPNIPMPSQPFDIPAYPVARQRAGTHAEQTADTGQTKFKVLTPATRKVTLTAVKFAGRVLASKELEEDSIIAILPFIEGELVDYLAADIEDALINGDTAGTHMDFDTTATDDPRKAWDGLRKRTQAGAKTDASAAALTVAMLRKNRKNMGKYGVNPRELVHILSINEYIDLLSDSAVYTLEKYGPQATILAGELGSVDSVPIIVSEYQRIDLNSSGVNDQTAANNTKTLALTMSRRGFVMGSRRGLTVDIAREIYVESDQDLVLASWRRAFQSLYPTTELTTAYHYNVLK
jgi:HK97 family phage major capsid protein